MRHYETGDSPAATHWGQASSGNQSECGRHSLLNILKLQATFLYSIYHQRAGKTNLFHIGGGRFHAGTMLCTFKNKQQEIVYMPSDTDRGGGGRHKPLIIQSGEVVKVEGIITSKNPPF